jgi:hypothetical protein
MGGMTGFAELGQALLEWSAQPNEGRLARLQQMPIGALVADGGPWPDLTDMAAPLLMAIFQCSERDQDMMSLQQLAAAIGAQMVRAAKAAKSEGWVQVDELAECLARGDVKARRKKWGIRL